MSTRHSNICQFCVFARPCLLLVLLKIKMLEKQVETDSEDGFKTKKKKTNRMSASREEQNETKLSAEMRSCVQ